MLLPVYFAGLAACASGEPVARERSPDLLEVARALACAPEEVAVCVDVSCEPHEYQCAHKADVKALLGVRDYPRR